MKKTEAAKVVGTMVADLALAAKIESVVFDRGGYPYHGRIKALAARWVVHTVGPVWRGGEAGEDAALASCYRRSLEVAAGAGARSIAFPAISTGVFGFPASRAADIAVRTVSAADPAVWDRVVLVAFDRGTSELYGGLLRDPR